MRRSGGIAGSKRRPSRFARQDATPGLDARRTKETTSAGRSGKGGSSKTYTQDLVDAAIAAVKMETIMRTIEEIGEATIEMAKTMEKTRTETHKLGEAFKNMDKRRARRLGWRARVEAKRA